MDTSPKSNSEFLICLYKYIKTPHTIYNIIYAYTNLYNKYITYTYMYLVNHGNGLCVLDEIMEQRITGLGGFKDGDLLIMIMHNVVSAAARKIFPTKLPFLFGSA